MFVDKNLTFVECGNEFIFSAGEQEFYADKGYQNEPKRCKDCRTARKNAAKPAREFFVGVCSDCGGEAKVPFQPTDDRPIYCSACFEEIRGQN